MDLHRAGVAGVGHQRIFPRLHLLRGGGQAEVHRAEGELGPPELAGGQGPAGDHPPAGHHLPHHHPPPAVSPVSRLPGIRPLPCPPPLHPGIHGDSPLLLPQHRGEGNPPASLETVEEYQVGIGIHYWRHRGTQFDL